MNEYARAIEQKANEIAEQISGNLMLIANDLKSRQLLSVSDLDSIVNPANPSLQRANTLVQRVITQVKIVPTQYQVFRSVLEKHLNPAVLANILPQPDGESVLHCMSV